MTQWRMPDLRGRIEDAWYTLDAGEGGEAAELIMAAMKLGGIDNLWFVSGSELAALQEAGAKAKALGRPAPTIRTMIHEHAALCAALGESMVTGRPTCACAHVELGLLNMGGAIHIASRGGYPTLMLTGAPSASYPGSGPGDRSHTVYWQQQIRDQGEIVRQYVKWDYKLAPYDNAGMAVTRALQVALTPPTGPVYLAMPRESAQARIEGIQRFPTLDQLTPGSGPAADPAQLRQVAQMLIQAESPVILTERLGRNPAALAPFQDLVELLGCRVIASGFRYNFPNPHPLRAPLPHRGFPDLEPYDAILVVDSPTPWLPGTTGPRAGTRIAWIDIDPIVTWIPMWEYPADYRLIADSALAIPALLEEVQRQLTPADRRRIEARRERLLDEGRAAIERDRRAAEADGALNHITPRYVSHVVGRLIDDETVVLGEGGPTAFIPRSKPGTLYFHGGASLGYSLAASVGAKVAQPDRRFLTLVGDGAYSFGLPSQSFWAAHQYRAPFLAIIFNNRGYSTGTTRLRDTYPDGWVVRTGDYSGGFFDPPPNYSAEAQAAGCFGEKVRHPEEVAPAIQRALDAVDKEGIPAVIDVWLPKHITGEL
ncbi:MAG: acetolactate synthase [Dehalococcoidia bacterium]|nr:MAG: acetolactate synthase [Dehalococcoidia bacterium]